MEPEKTRQGADVLAGEERAEVAGRGVQIPVAGAVLAGELATPAEAWGMVLIADGSSMVARHPTHHRCVTKALRRRGLATARGDLLTEGEQHGGSRGGALPAEIDLLADRLRWARDWLTQQEEVRGLRVGYFGGGCGTAAALRVAARETEAFGAMVMLGGRPDLVGEVLGQVRTPTLFIAGAGDLLVIEWNRKALLELGGEKDLRVIPGASHMFEEIGVIEDVAELAHGWYRRHLMV